SPSPRRRSTTSCPSRSVNRSARCPQSWNSWSGKRARCASTWRQSIKTSRRPRAGRASVQVGELQESLVADLTAARIRASERLADLLAAMEATRLDLLRLRAGQATADQITHTMTAVRELGDDIERLLSARTEIDATLATSPRLLGAEHTPA